MSQSGSQHRSIKSPFASLSILLVSTLPGFCTNLRTAIFRAKKLTAYQLKIHLCETLKQLFDNDEIYLNLDYIVFGLDIQKPNCVEQVIKDMKLLNCKLISSGALCMVISTNVPSFDMGVTWDSLLGLKSRYQMPMISGDTEDEDKCNYLGQRILCLVESVKGIHSGFPLSTATTHEIHEESVVATRRLAFVDI